MYIYILFNMRYTRSTILDLFVYRMTFTNEQQRKFIEQNFLNNQITNNIIKDTTPDNNMDIFIPDKKPSMYDINENTNDFKNDRIQEFKYLDDVILPNDIVLFSRDLTLNYKIHLCLFTINQELDIPFLQFMFSKNQAEYSFPSTDLNMDSFRTLNDDNSIATTDDNDMEIDNKSSNVNNDFINQCKIFFEKVTNNTDTNIQTIYRGFLEEDNDDNENMSENIYVFFDCTNITIDFEYFKSQDYTFAVVNEINQEKIYNMDINKNILALFHNNKFLTELNTLDGEPILIPKIAYICNKNEDNEYINEYYDDEYTMDIVSPQVNHDNFDDIYLFSREPLNGEYKNIKRFALFYDENNINKEESPKTENMDVENDDTSEGTSSDDEMDESSSDTSEGTSSDDEMDESINNDNTNKRKENIEMELEENEVFTFTENNDKLYGTYSIETFIEL